MHIAVDLDEVLAETLDSIIIFHNKRYGTFHRKEQFLRYAFWTVWGGTRKQAIQKVHDFFCTPEADSIQPVEGARQTLTALRKAGCRFSVVTARPDAFLSVTERWVERHFPDLFSGIYFTNHFGQTGSVKRKVDVCEELGARVLVEDDLRHVSDCLATDIRVLLFDRPWNQKDVPLGVDRIRSWDEVTVEVQRMLRM